MSNPTIEQLHSEAWWRAQVRRVFPTIDAHTREDVAAAVMGALLSARSRQRKQLTMLIVRRRIIDAMKHAVLNARRTRCWMPMPGGVAANTVAPYRAIEQRDDAAALARRICAAMPRRTKTQRRSARRAYAILMALSRGESVADVAVRLSISRVWARQILSRAKFAAASLSLRRA